MPEIQRTNRGEFPGGRWLAIVLAIVLCLWRIPFLNKGIDYTDTGFSLANYQEVFGGSGIQGIGIFMTNLLGGAIYHVLPSHHLLVFRILHWLCGLATAWLAYLLLRPVIRREVLLAVLLVLSLGGKSGEALFNYYVVTSFLLLLGMLLMRNGLQTSSSPLLAGSGMVCGVNVFFRLPNLLFLSIGAGIVLYGRLNGTSWKTIWRQCLWFALGAVAGIAVDLAFLCTFLTPAQCAESFMKYVNLALGRGGTATINPLGIEETGDAHSLMVLIRVIAIQTFRAMQAAVAYLLPVALLAWGISKLASNRANSQSPKTEARWFWGALGVFAIVFFLAFKKLVASNIANLAALAALLFCLVALVQSGRRSPMRSLFCFWAILLAGCAVLGSDLGLQRLGIYQMFLLPLPFMALGMAENGPETSEACGVQLAGKSRKCLAAVSGTLLLGLLLTGVVVTLPRTYMDASYGKLKAAVDNDIKVLRGMATSTMRAEALNEYHAVMGTPELAGRKAAIFGYFPLGFVLGPQKNYFSDVQPCIDYPSVKVSRLFKTLENKAEEQEPPLVVVSYVNQMQRHDDHFTSPAKEAFLAYMLGRADYRVIHQSRFFTIYKAD